MLSRVNDNFDVSIGSEARICMCGLTYGVNRRCRSGAVEGDENSRMFVEGVVHRSNVRVDLPTRRSRALHDEIAASSYQEGGFGGFQGAFAT